MATFEIEPEGAEVLGSDAPVEQERRSGDAIYDDEISDADLEESSEEEIQDEHLSVPFPKCVDSMDRELQRMLKVQLKGFRKHMVRAIERNQLEDLFALKSLFQNQVMGPFLRGEEFRRIIKPKKFVEEEELAEAEEKVLKGWQEKMIDLFQKPAKTVIEHSMFQTVMISSIVIAGLIVGATTYIDCGDAMSCRGIEPENRRACSDPSWAAPPSEDQCLSISCCFDSTVEVLVSEAYPFGFPNGTGVACFRRESLPECWDGDGADTLGTSMKIVEGVILIIFTAEVVLKLLAEGIYPHRYFLDIWNLFDFLIVAACYVPGGEDIAVLRLMRLARLLKVLHFIHELQIILKGLANGMSSITYILILLLLIFYLFAIISVITFGQNDPIHFGSLHMAMVTLFRMSTMEDWTDIMYINMWGCLNYGYIGGSYCYDESTCDMEELCSEDTGLSKGYGMSTALFFIVFIVVSGLVVMSLFIGVITTSMVEASEDAKTERKEAKMQENREKIIQQFENVESAPKIIAASSSAMRLDLEDTVETDKEATGALKAYLQLGSQLGSVINTSQFQNLIIGCILLAAALIGMQTYDKLDEQYSSFFTIADNGILGVFTLECVCKIVAEGRTPLKYFNVGWNVFDFVVVFACFMPFGGSAVAVLRLLRLLRVLKLFNNISELQIILMGLAKGMSSVSYIGLLMFLLFYVFGIISLLFFR